MAIFTREFPDTDQYEEWLEKAGERINVRKITNLPTMPGSAIKPAAGPIAVSYETDDPSLVPPRSRKTLVVQAVIVGLLFFALFLFLISKM